MNFSFITVSMDIPVKNFSDISMDVNDSMLGLEKKIVTINVKVKEK